jgi:hypothetical protein
MATKSQLHDRSYPKERLECLLRVDSVEEVGARPKWPQIAARTDCLSGWFWLRHWDQLG